MSKTIGQCRVCKVEIVTNSGWGQDPDDRPVTLCDDCAERRVVSCRQCEKQCISDVPNPVDFTCPDCSASVAGQTGATKF